MDNVSFSLAPVGPFSWQLARSVLASFPPMRRHAAASDEQAVRMTFALDGEHTPVGVALRWQGRELVGEVSGTRDSAAARAQVARIFSLDHDARGYSDVGARDPAVGTLMDALPGLRPVCFTSPYECAAWAIISQRISKVQAAAIVDRLLELHGHPVVVDGRTLNAFPTPERLAKLASLPGLSAEKLTRLRGIARAAQDEYLDAARLRALGDERAPESLRELDGIGPFWASGIYLRACGIVDVFPDEPLAVAALGAIHGLGDAPPAERVREWTQMYRPFRMWTCFLLRVAAARGLIEGIAPREGAIRRAARSGHRVSGRMYS